MYNDIPQYDCLQSPLVLYLLLIVPVSPVFQQPNDFCMLGDRPLHLGLHNNMYAMDWIYSLSHVNTLIDYALCHISVNELDIPTIINQYGKRVHRLHCGRNLFT